jgi:hypothetical protein
MSFFYLKHNSDYLILILSHRPMLLLYHSFPTTADFLGIDWVGCSNISTKRNHSGVAVYSIVEFVEMFGNCG